MTADPAEIRRGRRTLLLLATLFLVPLIVAFWLHYGGTRWRPAGSTHQGELLDPARPLPAVTLRKPDGSTTDAGFLREKWSVIYVGDGRCDARCRKALYLTRQSRIALNKDIDRVERVFLVTANCCDRALLETEHPDVVVALLEGDAGARLIAPFPGVDSAPATNGGGIYVVDPLGNLLLSYSSTAPDKALLQDLERLLRLSHIG